MAGNEYPITLWLIEIVEGLALIGVILFLIALWREVKVPEKEEGAA